MKVTLETLKELIDAHVDMYNTLVKGFEKIGNKYWSDYYKGKRDAMDDVVRMIWNSDHFNESWTAMFGEDESEVDQ